MKKRTAETLIEAVTAMTVFGIVSAGIFDFMANQTLAVARTKNNDTILYSAQKWISEGNYKDYDYDEELGVSRVWNKEDGTLTLTKGELSMTISLK